MNVRAVYYVEELTIYFMAKELILWDLISKTIDMFSGTVVKGHSAILESSMDY